MHNKRLGREAFVSAAYICGEAIKTSVSIYFYSAGI